MKNIFAVVVTYNGKKWIDKCIGSLSRSSTYINVIVIDNNSSDETVACLHNKFPTVHVVESDENLGFGRANNIGMNISIREGADYVFLLNQDAWVEPDTLSTLIAAHGKDHRYGLLSPLHFNGGGELLDKAFTYYLATGFKSNRKLLSNIILSKNLHDIYSINFINAAAWLLPRKTIELVGGFDPLFSHWGEDKNYYDRVKNKKIKVGVCPSSFIFHDREDSFLDKREFYLSHYYRYILLRILAQDNNMDFRRAKIRMFHDSIKPLTKFNLKKVHEIYKAHCKLQSNKAEILSRVTKYKSSYCFLEKEI